MADMGEARGSWYALPLRNAPPAPRASFTNAPPTSRTTLNNAPPTSRATLNNAPPTSRATLNNAPPTSRATLNNAPPTSRATLNNAPPTSRALLRNAPAASRALLRNAPAASRAMLLNAPATSRSSLCTSPTFDIASNCESVTSLPRNPIGFKALLRKVDLTATVGPAKLELGLQTNKIKLKGKGKISYRNVGSVHGKWLLRFAVPKHSAYFATSLSLVHLAGGAQGQLEIKYFGPEHRTVYGTLIFEQIGGNDIVTLKIAGSVGNPFPITAECLSMSWDQPGKKKIFLSNSTEERVHLKCRVIGDGFTPDLFSSRQKVLSFGPREWIPLYINFHPKSGEPSTATLQLASS